MRSDLIYGVLEVFWLNFAN